MWDIKHPAESEGILYNQRRSARTDVKKVHMRIFLVQFKQKNWIVHNFFLKVVDVRNKQAVPIQITCDDPQSASTYLADTSLHAVPFH